MAETETWMPLLDGLPLAVPDRQRNMLTGRETKWLRAIVITGEGLRVRHTATDFACWWSGWHDKGRPEDDPRWDAALVSVAHPENDSELLVLDCDEADAWIQCLLALDRLSGGAFAAEDLERP